MNANFKKVLSALIALSILLLSACVGNKNGQNTPDPSQTHSDGQVLTPTSAPTQAPATEAPTAVPTDAPTDIPTEVPTEVPTEAPTEVPTEVPTELPTEEPTEEPFERPAVKFSDMVYERPDLDQCVNKMTAFKNKIEAGTAGQDEIIDDAFELFGEEIANWNSMYSISNIYFSISPFDEYWSGETGFYNDANPVLENKLDQVLVSCARSWYKEILESELLGEGVLDRYVNGSVFTEKLAELKQKEADLITKFETIDYDSLVFKVGSYSGTFEQLYARFEKSGNYEFLEALYANYMLAIKKAAGSIFIDLVKVRHEMAKEAGYDSYEEYAFKEELERDYTPEEALKLTEGMRDIINPLLAGDLYTSKFIEEYSQFVQYPVMLSYGEVMEYSGKGLAAIDSSLAEVFKYMEDLELCYLGYDSDQVGMSFTTFIANYAAPYIVIQGSSDINDMLTMIHEFGHFYDNYINLGGNVNLDICEVSSTALALLFSRYLDQIDGFNSQQRTAYSAQLKLNTLDIFASQSMYHKFEHMVYLLPEEQLSIDTLSAIALQVEKEFGSEEGQFEDMWPMITHFFIQPFYVISYVTSSAVSLQMYEKELENKGSGIESYMNFINAYDPAQSFRNSVEQLGLKLPFTDEGLASVKSAIYKMIN